MIKQSAIILMSLLALGSTAAMANHQHKNGLKPILKQLDLSQEQRQDLRQLLRESKGDMQSVSQDMKAFRQNMLLLVQADTYDQDAVTSLLEENQEVRTQKRLRKAQKQHLLFQSLTPEQQDKFVSLIAAKTDTKRHNKANKMYRRLGLTDQQKGNIKQIKSAFKATRSEAIDTLKQRKQAELALVRSAQFDAKAWLALQQQYRSTEIDIAEQRAAVRNQVWNQLTLEQQQKAAARMDRIKQKRNRRNEAI